MRVEIPNMLVSMVGIVLSLAAAARAGYTGHTYHAPSASLQGPHVNHNHYGNSHNYNNRYPALADQASHQYLGTSVSYSVAPNDYNYLRQYQGGNYLQQSGFTPITIHPDNNYQINHHNSANNGYYSQPSQSNDGSGNLILSQELPQQTSSGSGSVNHGDYSHSYISQPAPAPAPAVVTKHIYFHVPPQEMEERLAPILPPTPPKKIYNIVFIKVPSQESRNRVNIPGLVANQQALVEDKTLIYVLVRRPEPLSLPQLQPPVNSEHEVFYVKYNGNANEVASQINDNLSQQGSLRSTSSVVQSDVQSVIEPILQSQSVDAGLPQSLQPGLINGRL